MLVSKLILKISKKILQKFESDEFQCMYKNFYLSLLILNFLPFAHKNDL